VIADFGEPGVDPRQGFDPELTRFANQALTDATRAMRQVDCFGVGVDFAANQAFFTRNGGLVGAVKLDDTERVGDVEAQQFHVAFHLRLPGQSARINCGAGRFIFDLEEFASQPPPPPKLDLSAELTDIHPHDHLWNPN
jgi:hypothetical protein